MSRRHSIVFAVAFFASAFVVPGCSSNSTSTIAPLESSAAKKAIVPLTRTWITEAPMPTARRFLAAGSISEASGSVVYAVGGAQGGSDVNTLEAYNVNANTWETEAPMPTARENLGVGVIRGALYAVGGNENGFGALTTVEAYHPSTNTWVTKAPMLTAQNAPAVAVDNDILYAIGGDDADGHFLNTVEAYNPRTNKWTALAPLPTAESGMAAAVVNGIVYAIGGQDGVGLATNDAYDPATNAWTAEPAMLMPSSYFGAVAFGNTYSHPNQVWAVGGGDGGASNYVESYNPSTITWIPKVSMPTGRYGLAVVVAIDREGMFNPTLYAIGGYDGSDLNTVEALPLYF
jgi:hypothetical protein